MTVTVVADPRASSRGELRVPGTGSFACALGRGGVHLDKREGDGTTPAGRFPLRRVWYRADRLEAPPASALPARALRATDGWCDDPASPDYNRHVSLPHPARHERLWRNDAVYDVLVELGFNDDPPVPGRGSAIFLHVARPDLAATEGCVALALEDLLTVLRSCRRGDMLMVLPAEEDRPAGRS